MATTIINIPRGTPTRIQPIAGQTTYRIQNTGDEPICLRSTDDTTAPTDFPANPGFKLPRYETARIQEPSGGAIWAYSPYEPVQLALDPEIE